MGKFVSDWQKPITGVPVHDRAIKRRLQKIWGEERLRHIEIWEISGDYVERTLKLVLFCWLASGESGFQHCVGAFEVFREIEVPPKCIRSEALFVDVEQDAALATICRDGKGLILMGISPVVLAAKTYAEPPKEEERA